MPIDCDVILRDDATPEQLRALGRALWRWSLGTARQTSICGHVDNQTLADLIDGLLPARPECAGRGGPPGVRFRIRNESSDDRWVTADGLRRAVPADGLLDVLVAGRSWREASGEPVPVPPTTGQSSRRAS